MPNLLKISLLNFVLISCAPGKKNDHVESEREHQKTNSISSRTAIKKEVGSRLEGMNNEQLGQLLASKKESTSVITLGGSAVFIKRIPLTPLEQEKANYRSTANIFDLPLFFQYPVGSSGFGAWRELAGNIEVSDWVVSGKNQHFPILYHWRVLPRKVPMLTEEGKKSLNENKVKWGNSQAIYNKNKAMELADAELILFLEAIPMPLHQWIENEATHGWPNAGLLPKFEQEILSTISFMHKNGMFHLDTHPHNILTDGHSVYFADFGLMSDLKFDLSIAEKNFLKHHDDFDVGRAMMELCVAALAETTGTLVDEATIRDYSAGHGKVRVPKELSKFIQRWGETAIVMDKFLTDLRNDPTKTTPYPEAEIRKAINHADNFDK
jgi:hypothetical protein